MFAVEPDFFLEYAINYSVVVLVVRGGFTTTGVTGVGLLLFFLQVVKHVANIFYR